MVQAKPLYILLLESLQEPMVILTKTCSLVATLQELRKRGGGLAKGKKNSPDFYHPCASLPVARSPFLSTPAPLTCGNQPVSRRAWAAKPRPIDGEHVAMRTKLRPPGDDQSKMPTAAAAAAVGCVR